jgi:hypothetical protein
MPAAEYGERTRSSAATTSSGRLATHDVIRRTLALIS